MRLTTFLLAMAALAACGREEEPVANQVARQNAEVENKAAAYEREVANEVAATEAQLEKEADMAVNLAEQNAADENEAEAARPPSQPPP